MTTKSVCQDVCRFCAQCHEEDELDQCPSPESIRMACLSIQNTWNEAELRERRNLPPDLNSELIKYCRLVW